MSRLGQVSLTKPTYRRIVLRCCSVPQAKPSPDYEYRISLRRHPVGHPSSSTRDSASRAVPSSIRVRRDGYREAGEWQQAGGDQRDRAAQKVFARAGSRKPRSISIRSARPPIITVMSGLAAPDRQRHWLSALAAEVIAARAPGPKWFHERQAGGARDSNSDLWSYLENLSSADRIRVTELWRQRRF